jgi:hypothetical protein
LYARFFLIRKISSSPRTPSTFQLLDPVTTISVPRFSP